MLTVMKEIIETIHLVNTDNVDERTLLNKYNIARGTLSQISRASVD